MDIDQALITAAVGAFSGILGAIVALTGIGLLLGRQAARWVGVILVAINAIAQIVWFPAAPLWSFLLIPS